VQTGGIHKLHRLGGIPGNHPTRLLLQEHPQPLAHRGIGIGNHNLHTGTSGIDQANLHIQCTPHQPDRHPAAGGGLPMYRGRKLLIPAQEPGDIEKLDFWNRRLELDARLVILKNAGLLIAAPLIYPIETVKGSL
jgi:hypothetical protein